MRVLVADDDIFFLKVTTDILQEAGHEVRAARSGKATLKLALEFRPDLIVADVVMPDIRGTEISQKLRGNPHTKGIPILLTSAGVGEFDGTGSGDPTDYSADDFLLKPFEPEHLLARIERLIKEGPREPKEPGDKADDGERRSQPRVFVDIEVTSQTAKALLTNPALNISTGGVCITANRPIKDGTWIGLRFSIPGSEDPIRAEGKVAWCQRKGDSGRWMVGIRFTKLKDADRERIESFVRALIEKGKGVPEH